MKVTCESCGAHYSIADEKVRGRRVKVRCKSCSTPIIVDGHQLEADLAAAALASTDDEESTRVMSTPANFGSEPPAPDAWMVNLNDTDQRSMTTEEIVQGWQQGLVREDTFVWRDGMDDWLPVFEAQEIREAIDAAETAAVPPAAEAMPPAAAAPASAPRGHDLFGNIAQAGSEHDVISRSAPPAAAAMSYADAAAEKPTGARNENSVLFSLDALKAGFTETAQKAPGPKAPAPRRDVSSSDLFGMGGGGGSVGNPLFGMDANAALLTAPAPEPEPPPPPAPSPASTYSPMTMSPAPGRGGINKLVIGLGAGLAVLVIAVIGLAVVLTGGDDEEATAKAGSGEDSKKEGKSAKDDEAKDDEAKDDEAKDDEAKDEAKDGEAKDEAEEKKAEEKPPANASPEAQKAFAAAMAKKREAAKSTTTSTKAPEPTKEEAKPTVKEEKSSGVASFNKGAAISALSVAAAQASGCKRPDGPTGTGRAIVTFAPSGNVTSANVTGGSFAGTSVGGCVAGVFRRARVPPFSGGAVTVSKSFTISP